jgi:N-glycosylase/DNA lyase
VRFHNVKARRLLLVHERAEELRELLGARMPDKELRDILAGTVDGLGMKEASHVLRNIGRTGVTIVDRHILRNMIRLGMLPSWPASISRGRYLDIEQRFEDLAQQIGIPHDELDLLLWRRETGFILK